jgi:hypothetical protein
LQGTCDADIPAHSDTNIPPIQLPEDVEDTLTALDNNIPGIELPEDVEVN